MAHNEDEDLDALLDEAMNIVEDQDNQQKENMEKEKEKLDSDILKALDELGNNDAEDIMKQFQALLGAGANEEINENTFNDFMRSVGTLLPMLEGASSLLSDEDKKNLDCLKELINVMDNKDDAKAEELLAELKKTKPELANMKEPSPADVGAKFQEYAESMSQIKKTVGEMIGTTEAAEGQKDEIPADWANMLLSAILDPQFVEPIKVMRDAYGPWLEAHPELSSEDRERYTQQHQKTIDISEFLQTPVNKEDTERVEKLLHMMHEFSALGELPQDLFSFAKKA